MFDIVFLRQATTFPSSHQHLTSILHHCAQSSPQHGTPRRLDTDLSTYHFANPHCKSFSSHLHPQPYNIRDSIAHDNHNAITTFAFSVTRLTMSYVNPHRATNDIVSTLISETTWQCTFLSSDCVHSPKGCASTRFPGTKRGSAHTCILHDSILSELIQAPRWLCNTSSRLYHCRFTVGTVANWSLTTHILLAFANAARGHVQVLKSI